MWDFSIGLAAGNLFTHENESRAWSQLSAGQVFGKIWVLAKSAVAIHVNYIYSGFTPVDGVYIFIYKISKIVHTLWLAKRSVCVRVCKHSCDVKMFCFSRANHTSTNLKKFLSSKLDEFTLFTHSFVGWNLENLYKQTEKTADISQLQHWYHCEIRPGEWVQKFHSDDASFLRSGKCFWLVEVNFLCGIYKQKYKPDVGSSTYIGMQFLCSFLRRHFTGQPVVTLWNVCFFLMLNVMQLLSIYLYFLLSFASLEDGTTQTTTSPPLSLLLCSQIWRETTDIVHASHSMKDALQQSQRKN